MPLTCFHLYGTGMLTPVPFNQAIGDVIRVDEWEPDDEFPYMPIGQKPKRMFVCPTPAPREYLLAGHRYLFKEPRGHAAQQIWSEVIAFRLALYRTRFSGQ